MPTYREIPDAEIDKDGPLLETSMYALRDNPKLVWEGDPTAPKIAPQAILQPTAGTTHTLWYGQLPGDAHGYGAEHSVGKYPFAAIADGVVTLSFEVDVYWYQAPHFRFFLFRYRNGVLTTLIDNLVFPSDQGVWVLHTYDVAIEIGDLVWAEYHTTNAYEGERMYLRNLTVKSGTKCPAVTSSHLYLPVSIEN